MAHKNGRDVHLIRRTGNDHTARFPGVAAAVAKLPTRSAILDGEIAVFDERLVSRFDWLVARSPASVAPA